MLNKQFESTLKDAASKLTGFKKRAFMAQVDQDYFQSSPRKTESQLGWSRKAIATGLKAEVLNGEKSRTKFDIIDKKTK